LPKTNPSDILFIDPPQPDRPGEPEASHAPGTKAHSIRRTPSSI
jgi:hypothetical protein